MSYYKHAEDINKGTFVSDLPALTVTLAKGTNIDLAAWFDGTDYYATIHGGYVTTKARIALKQMWRNTVGRTPCVKCGVEGCTCWTLPDTQPSSTYADGNPKSTQGAKKYSLRYLPLAANIAVNQALEDGAKKYGPANWRETGVAASVYVDAALRHIGQFFDGKQDNASDSGVHNLGHAMACMAIIIDAAAAGKLIDDRPFCETDTDALLTR